MISVPTLTPSNHYPSYSAKQWRSHWWLSRSHYYAVLYFAQVGDLVKIGQTIQPTIRFSSLKCQVRCRINVLAVIPHLGYYEKPVLEKLSHLRIRGNEWFYYTSEVDDVIQEMSDHWTTIFAMLTKLKIETEYDFAQWLNKKALIYKERT